MLLNDRHELIATTPGKFANGRVGRQPHAMVLPLDLSGQIGVLLLSHAPKPKAKRSAALARATNKAT
ncbi:hypothetical protein KB1_21270 [Cutibacterium modestum]|uniref:Uncharacterized protein n=1 Tax=Cutibacterium modestum TaxID=2559073 RepID=A0AAD1NVN9_9ACTN|nr:hypothetical protein KB1_21270 [Cutibacterium modestum]